MIREDFLQQNAFVDIDSFSEYKRQDLMLGLIQDYETLCRAALDKGAKLYDLFGINARVGIGRAKTVAPDQYEEVYAKIHDDMEAQIAAIAEKGDED